MHSFSKTRFDNNFTIAVYQDEHSWVAYNLEMDIVAVDRNKQKAVNELRGLTMGHIEFCLDHNAKEELFKPAPARFWEMVAEKKTARVQGFLTKHERTVEEIKKMLTTTPVVEIDPSSRLAQAR